VDPGERVPPEKAPEQAARYVALTQSILTTNTILTMALQLIPFMDMSVATKFIDNIYWGLGLGFLGWQVMAPPTRKAVLEPLDEYYNRRYRTRLLPPGTARMAYRHGTITKEELEDILARHGWDDKSFEAAVAMEDKRLLDRVRADRLVPRSVAEWLYYHDIIYLVELADIYRAHGYTDEAITLLLLRAMERKAEIKAGSPQLGERAAGLKSVAEELRRWILQLRRFGATDKDLEEVLMLYEDVKGLAIEAMTEDIPKRVYEWLEALDVSEIEREVPVMELVKPVPDVAKGGMPITGVVGPQPKYREGQPVTSIPEEKAKRLPRRRLGFGSPLVRDIDIYLANVRAAAAEQAKPWRDVLPVVPVARPEVMPDLMRAAPEWVKRHREQVAPVKPERVAVPAPAIVQVVGWDDLVRAVLMAAGVPVPPKPRIPPVARPGAPVKVKPVAAVPTPASPRRFAIGQTVGVAS